MHLQSDVRHHDEIVAARIGKVVMFHSTVEELQNHAADLAFAVIVDPDKCLYTGRSDTASDRSSANNDPHPPSTRTAADSTYQPISRSPATAAFSPSCHEGFVVVKGSFTTLRVRNDPFTTLQPSRSTTSASYPGARTANQPTGSAPRAKAAVA
jgi:hypothetical protein